MAVLGLILSKGVVPCQSSEEFSGIALSLNEFDIEEKSQRVHVSVEGSCITMNIYLKLNCTSGLLSAKFQIDEIFIRRCLW